jgi:hypothetical protein
VNKLRGSKVRRSAIASTVVAVTAVAVIGMSGTTFVSPTHAAYTAEAVVQDNEKAASWTMSTIKLPNAGYASVYSPSNRALYILGRDDNSMMIAEPRANAVSPPLKANLLTSPEAIADDPDHHRLLISTGDGRIVQYSTDTFYFNSFTVSPVCGGSLVTGLVVHRAIDRVIAVCANSQYVLLNADGVIVGGGSLQGASPSNIVLTNDDKRLLIGSSGSQHIYTLATLSDDNLSFSSIRSVSSDGTGASGQGTVVVPVGTDLVVVQDAARGAGSLSLYYTQSHIRLARGLDVGPQPIASGFLDRDGKLWGFADNRAVEVDTTELKSARSIPTGAKPLSGKVASVDQTTNTVWVLLENSLVGLMTIP